MYYEDLSLYTYYKPSDKAEKVRSYFGIAAAEEVELLNIGWLEDDTIPFRVGAPDPRVLDCVAALCLTRQGLMRGFHICRLCTSDDLPKLPLVGTDEFVPDMMTELHSGRQIGVGNGEIWFRGPKRSEASGTVRVFIAPTMLLHYMKMHRYLPPDEAIEALLCGALP